MPGPARAGAMIFARDAARLAEFYGAVLGMRQLHARPELIVLESPDMQLLIHAVPAHIALDPEGNVFQVRESTTAR